MNQTTITITGNLAADPELRITPNGKATVRMRIAATDRWRDETGTWIEGTTSWHTAIAWGTLAELCADRLTKGDPVIVHGRLTQRTYTNPDNEHRHVWEITAEDIGALLRRNTTGGTSGTWQPGDQAVPVGI